IRLCGCSFPGRVSEIREDTGLSSTGSAHCTATRCASPRLPNAQGLIQGSTTDATSDRNRSSMGTTAISLYQSLREPLHFPTSVLECTQDVLPPPPQSASSISRLLL